MLATLLYTGTDCYKELRDCERRGDYTTWWKFSMCLRSAIDLLGGAEHKEASAGVDMVFTGLNKVKLSGEQLEKDMAMAAPTFTSTSTDRTTADQYF